MSTEDKIKKGLEEFESDGGNWDDKFQDLERRINETGSKPIKKKRWKTLALVLLLLIVGGLLIYLVVSSKKSITPNEEIFLAYYEPAPALFNTSNRDNGAQILNNALARAGKAYSSRDYQTAYDLWSQNIQDSLYHNYRPFHAIAAVEIGNDATAIEILKSDHMLTKDELSSWYLALLLLKNNEPAEAKRLLIQIGNDAQHYKNEAAKKILASLPADSFE